MATEALREGARFGKLVDKLPVNKPTTFSNLMGIAQKYFELDEGRRAIRGKEAKGKESKEKSKEKSKSKSEDRRGRPEENRRFAPQTRYEPRYDPRDDENNFTPLNTNRTIVLMWIKENVKNMCIDLKVEIERMIDTGELRKFVARKEKSNDKGEKKSRDDKAKEKEDKRTSKILGTIHMINGGGHSSSTIRRKQRREVMNIRETHMPPVIFDVEDYEHVKAPHNDALIGTTIIENWNTERILIDEGSAVNLMTNAVYKMLGATASRLRRVPIPLSGLGGPSINPLGAVTLEVIIGPERGINKKVMSLFNIVDMELTYNAILERPFLHDSAAVTSIRALAMKIPTEKGAVTLRGDQNIAKKCYNESIVDLQENKTEKKEE
ncbi:uncharacterized protein LOC126678292 [Mercurialis annua]|uniref:uncharacterized protein LOC126678292 n=1 Tax=Mercurialis annua TaxID=3986 RepID=UPI00215FC844|nr:uncharacterized protein LOC126678292 [Mercurialis annua]